MKIHRILLSAILLAIHFTSFSQDTISMNQVENVIRYLASDSMRGRGNASPQLTKAARFIATQFKMDSLMVVPGSGSYMLPFILRKDLNGNVAKPFTVYNVVGVLEGKTKPDEVIIFSAHYDHVGVDKNLHKDSIFNGANDNASGTTALLTLAHYYSMKNDNARTLVFCAFAGEEWGLWGSDAFTKNINSESVVAMVNIEMIGSRHGIKKNSFFVTGADYSDFASILKKNLKGSPYKIVNEPVRGMLFERSDNYNFASKGVPAHSIMCSDDSDPCYHQPCDEVDRLDLVNMTNIIKAIAIASRTLVDGTDTPKRISL